MHGAYVLTINLVEGGRILKKELDTNSSVTADKAKTQETHGAGDSVQAYQS